MTATARGETTVCRTRCTDTALGEPSSRPAPTDAIPQADASQAPRRTGLRMAQAEKDLLLQPGPLNIAHRSSLVYQVRAGRWELLAFGCSGLRCVTLGWPVGLPQSHRRSKGQKQGLALCQVNQPTPPLLLWCWPRRSSWREGVLCCANIMYCVNSTPHLSLPTSITCFLSRARRVRLAATKARVSL